MKHCLRQQLNNHIVIVFRMLCSPVLKILLWCMCLRVLVCGLPADEVDVDLQNIKLVTVTTRDFVTEIPANSVTPTVMCIGQQVLPSSTVIFEISFHYNHYTMSGTIVK